MPAEGGNWTRAEARRDGAAAAAALLAAALLAPAGAAAAEAGAQAAAGGPGLGLLCGVGLGAAVALAGMGLVQFIAWRDPAYLWFSLAILLAGTASAVGGVGILALGPGRSGPALAAQPVLSGGAGLFGALFVRSFLAASGPPRAPGRALLLAGGVSLLAGPVALALPAVAPFPPALAAAALGLGLALGASALRPFGARAAWYLVGVAALAASDVLLAAAAGLPGPAGALPCAAQAGVALAGVALALALADSRVGESEERFRVAFETSPDAIAINRVEDGVYLAINQGFTAVSGWTQADLVGRSSLDLSIWADPRDRARMIEELLRRGTVRNLEFPFHYKDGRTGIGLMSARLIRLRGKPHVLSITREISSLKAAEAERARLQDELRQAQKMDAIGRLAGGVAHDFNNLLTAISANVGLGLSETRPGDPVRPLLEEVEDAVRRATGLTRQLLAFSRRQPVTRRWISLSGLVDGSRKLLARILGEDIHLDIQLAATPLVIVADRGLVEQVVMNLAVNARDAVAPGGRIAIETRAAELREASPDRPAGRYAVLSVRDDGHGMDPETQRRIFEPFFTTKPGDRGTGIGLATVYGIVRQHGGSIEVRSEPGRGSTFEVYWPLADEAEAPGRAEGAGASMPRGTETLLLVEDEAKVREPTRALLERLGYRVLVAESGAEALAAAASHPGPIDLVVTDVVMPRMNGAELSSRLRAARPQTRVLFMSGYDDRILARHGLDEGALELLSKPFTAEVLAARVRAILDGARGGPSAAHP